MTRAALNRSALTLTLLVTALLAGTGCRATSFYVNIPEQEGDVARHDPNLETVREAAAVALAATLDDQPTDGPVMIRLPEGSDPLTYADVSRRAGDPFVTPYDGVEAQIEMQVTGVRLRSRSGSIDIVRPGRGGTPQLVTVHLKTGVFSGWYEDYVRRHGVPVTDENVYYPLQDTE